MYVIFQSPCVHITLECLFFFFDIIITYTITVTNGGPSTATGATIVDTLPASLTTKLRPVTIDRPAVRHTVWRAANGSRLVLLLNESRADATVKFKLPAASDWRLTRLGATTSTQVSPEVELTLRGLEVVALTTQEKSK